MYKLFNRCLKFLFLFCIIKPIVFILIGLNIRHRERLPLHGPLIVVANHNSHLDAPVLMSLFPYKQFAKIRPVAAADYFLKNTFLRWFSTEIFGILPIERMKGNLKTNPLEPIYQSLEKGEIIIFFPEGTRGEPEQRQSFKKGISHIAEQYPSVPIIPIFLYGLGKSLPRGEALLVPFFCEVSIGEPLERRKNHTEFINNLEHIFKELSNQTHIPPWE